MLNDKRLVAFVPTKDFAKARQFYETTLGLRFVAEDGHAVVFDANGTMLRISKAGNFTPLPFTILGWQSDDIAVDVAALQKRGVEFERYGFFEQDELGIWTAPTGDKVAWFKDPDGNTLSLSQHV